MSNGSNVRPKTMMFRPKSQAGGPVSANVPVVASQSLPGAELPPAVDDQAVDDQPQVERLVVASAVPTADPPVEVKNDAEPDLEASPVGNQAPPQETDRPHSRKFTLKKSPDEKPLDAAAGVQTVESKPAADAPSGKGALRFGKKNPAAAGSAAPAAPRQAVQGAQTDGRPMQVKSFLGAYIRLSVWGVFVCIVSFFVYWLATRGSTAGHFGAIIGRVEVVSGKHMKIAESQVRLRAGDQIKATPGSAACVLLEGVDSVQVYGPSEVVIRVLKQQEKQPAIKAIELSHGTIDLDVVLPVPDRLFIINTPNASVSFTAGRFLVVRTNNATRLSVREGLITIAHRGGDKQSLQVEAGYEVIAEEGVPLVAKSLSGDTTVRDLFLLTVLDTPFEGVDSPLKSSVVVDRNKQVALLAVKAVPEPPEGVSVKFEMKGCPPVIVNEPPYIFRGPAKEGAVGEGWNPERGDYTLIVTAYSRKDAKGKPSFPKSVLFKVKGVVEY